MLQELVLYLPGKLHGGKFIVNSRCSFKNLDKKNAFNVDNIVTTKREKTYGVTQSGAINHLINWNIFPKLDCSLEQIHTVRQ